MGSCDKEDPETCPYGNYKCGSSTKEIAYGMKWKFTESDNMKY